MMTLDVKETDLFLSRNSYTHRVRQCGETFIQALERVEEVH